MVTSIIKTQIGVRGSDEPQKESRVIIVSSVERLRMNRDERKKKPCGSRGQESVR